MVFVNLLHRVEIHEAVILAFLATGDDRLLMRCFGLFEAFIYSRLKQEDLNHVFLQSADLAKGDALLESRELFSLHPVQLIFKLVRIHIR